MKNFKKVISVVMALAMIISSFTAVSAASFADVADTAAYAEAVQVLKALGVVNGVAQENGTFNFEPEKEVTRAEAVTMIVGALNLTDDAKASAATSQFGDVNSQAAWAAGYVNVGVAQGFIAGYDASTFGPLDNVTYAQLCVMLTKVTGYGEYAEAYGGWPTGYTTIAATTGINKGVAVAQDAKLTKGQVAIMIWNALVTPKLGVDTYAINGNEYKPQDGKDDREFKTLFSEKFNGYVATITIEDTPVSAGNDKASNEFGFKVKKAAWWEEEESPIPAKDKKYEDTLREGTFAADVDVNSNYKQEGKAVFLLDDADEPVLVYFASNGKVKTKEVAADTYYLQADLGATNKFATSNKIRFGTSYYKLGTDKVAGDATVGEGLGIKVYVNGSEFTTINSTDTGIATTLDTILGNATGTIKLVKTDDADYYNSIFVDYYQVAKVTSVVTKADSTTITLGKTGAAIASSAVANKIVIDDEAIEEGDTVVTVTRNGEAADLTSIVKGDIIAYATDFTKIASNAYTNPTVIDILATNDTASGLVTKADAKENEYTIGGVDYEAVPGLTVADLAVTNTLELVLDPFGRIFATEMDASAAKYAIALKENADDTISLLLADGTVKSYEFKTGVSLASSIFAEKDPAKRVVEYKLQNSTGYIAYIKPVTGKSYTDEEYTVKSGRLAGSSITDATPIVYAPEVDFTDASVAKKASSYELMTKEELTDGTTYDVTMFTEGTYVNLVLVTRVGTAFNEASRFAVVLATPSTALTEEGDAIAAVKVLYEGEEQEIGFADGVFAKYGLAIGDAFFFTTDSDGLVDAVYKVFDKKDNYISLFDAIENKEKIDDPSISADDIKKAQSSLMDTDTGVWGFNIWNSRDDIVLAEGIVVYVEGGYISFATEKQIDAGSLNAANYINSDANGIIDYDFAEDCVAYVYDSASEEKEEYRYSVVDGASVRGSSFGNFEDDKDYTQMANKDGLKMADYAHNALALIVDGEIVEIYVIER